MPNMVFITREECQQHLTPKDALQLAEQALLWEASGDVIYANPKSLRLQTEQGLTFHSRAVALPALNVLGTRVVSYQVDPEGRRPGADESTRLVILIDMDTGNTLAIVDEHYNYALRTAASVGVAAKYLAAANPVLGVVGAGVVARAVIAVMLEALPLESVQLYSRTSERAEALADSFRDLTDVPFFVCSDVDEVAIKSNVLVTATTARDPFIRGEHLKPGMTLFALGTNELDGASYESCDRLIVDNTAQTLRSEDIAALMLAGWKIEESISGELPGLVAGSVPTRKNPAEIIVVRTDGLASQDITFAHFVLKAHTREPS